MRALLAALLLLLTGGCTDQPKSLLERVKQRGELIVVTRNGPTSYYVGPTGPAGLEYELANRFAKQLGVRLRLIVPDHAGRTLEMLANGEADLAAAGLTITDRRQSVVRFGPIYQEITQQIVYRRGNRKPSNVSDLSEGQLEVAARSSHADRLRELAVQYPGLTWHENGQLENEGLLDLVSQQLIDFTVVDSNVIAINQRFYPELRVAFDISEPMPVAWAFARGEDDSLYDAADAFFAKLRQQRILEQLLERYYGHVAEFDYVGTRLYTRHIKQRLPRYREAFEQAAKENQLDWRLLAAMGYQESHWNPRARSPTGVRGIMMLTLNTASQMDVDNRLDPEQSIDGGARYFRNIKRRVPKRIAEPDRTWMALAAYNVGFGHLEDARKLTEARGGDPDRWVDVKETLPLLSQKQWYKRTRYGYARGREPVRYVENIRSYYDLLVWSLQRDEAYSVPAQAPSAPSVSSPVL